MVFSNRRFLLSGVMAVAIVGGVQQAHAVIPFQDGFEAGVMDWTDYGAPQVRVPSGGGVVGAPSSSGSFHLELHNAESSYQAGQEGSGGFTFFGGSQNSLGGEWYHSTDIYVDLDPASPTYWAPPTAINSGVPGFWMDSALQMLNPADSTYRRAYEDETNYNFSVVTPGTVEVTGGGVPLATITQTGWYRFIQTYETSAPTVQNEFYVIDLANNWTISTPVSVPSGTYLDDMGTPDASDDVLYGPLQSSQLGGNSYLWSVAWQNGFAGDVIAIDNLTTAYGEPELPPPAPLPEPASLGLLTLGGLMMLRRRRKA